jgi:CBS domain containing-hemolysin-like protein
LDMASLLDPSILVGFFTLVVLEIILGIDNLIFIAILAEKVPPHQRDRARLIGLSLAMLMRLGLLAIISWLVTLTAPLFSIGSHPFSGRDLILFIGGVFLLFKATTELHDRLEGKSHVHTGPKIYTSLAVVITQIVVLDAVFSLDSVITAIGMVDELAVMMAAVIISMAVMILASKPLTRFVNAHSTVVVLCLSFLLMIGLSLVAEGLGFKIPKGYLYAAIGFSIVIEFFNQVAHRNSSKKESHIPLRERTADAVLRLLGKKTRGYATEENENATLSMGTLAFDAEERNMVSGVLTLGERTIHSIMTPRSEISWINLDDTSEIICAQIQAAPHNLFPVSRHHLDNMIGVGRAKDLIGALAFNGKIDESLHLREPIVLPGSVGVLKAMETLKRSHGQLVLVSDEYGSIVGLVTPIDILEAIAGEFPDEDEQLTLRLLSPGLWLASGAADLHYLEQMLETDSLVTNRGAYTSLAGFLLAHFKTLPTTGQMLELDGFRYEIMEIVGQRISTVHISSIEV